MNCKWMKSKRLYSKYLFVLMINDGNDNYLHPYRGVSLPNDCRSIFTSAVIANYASHDQPGLLRARMWRERAEWAGMSRDVNFWDYLLRVERTGLITGGRGILFVESREEQHPGGCWHLHTRVSVSEVTNQRPGYDVLTNERRRL